MSKLPWLDEALAEMRAAGRPGVVVVVPDGPSCLGEFSDRLQELFSGLNELDARPVFACVRESTARARFGDGAALLALDVQGRRVGAKPGNLDELLQPPVFTEALKELLGGMSVPSTPGAPRLPYGLEWAEEQHHKLFGTAYDPCPPCGMPRVENNSSQLIRYLRVLDEGR